MRSFLLAIVLVGIGGVAGFVLRSISIEETARNRAWADMDAIAGTISDFQKRNGRLPARAELADLPLIQSRPLAPNGEIAPGGMRVAELRDPFDQRYLYTRFADADGFLLKSFGQDQKDSEDDYIWCRR